MSNELIKKYEGLTSSQKDLFNAIRSGANVCCIGPGGTGKTYTLDLVLQCIAEQNLNALVCAPTGIVSSNLRGSTIHRAFGAERGILGPDSVKTNKLLEAADIIVIDEISMVRRDLFDFIIRSVRLTERNLDETDENIVRRPFKQIVVCGDFAQLPPVLTPDERERFYALYDSRYPFSSPYWEMQKFQYVVLREQMRQANSAFAAKLDRVRRCDASVLREFRQNDVMSETAVTLCTCNKTADRINDEHMARLEGHRTYIAGTFPGITEEEIPVSLKMTLAPGEQVMFVNNDRWGRWMNGSLATILSCNDDNVAVRMHDGRMLTVCPYSWPIYRDVLLEEVMPNGKVLRTIDHRKVGDFTQYPLRPAWAITVHKAQGQTYEEVNIAPGRFFDSGQLYVALSRCRTEDGLHITGKLRERDLLEDRDILDFMEKVNEKAIN